VLTTEELFRKDACLRHRAARVISSVRTIPVKPPRGQGRVRLVEIGRVEIARVEKKGRLNRRVVVRVLA